MTKEELVLGLKKRLVDTTIDEYKNRFEQVDMYSKSNNYDLEVKEFYESLSPREREILLKIVWQTEVDTVADFFGFLDGIYWIEGQTEDMNLVNLKNPERKLNEDLTDTFLNLIHKWDR